jgi:hypothetical protein
LQFSRSQQISNKILTTQSFFAFMKTVAQLEILGYNASQTVTGIPTSTTAVTVQPSVLICYIVPKGFMYNTAVLFIGVQ